MGDVEIVRFEEAKFKLMKIIMKSWLEIWDSIKYTRNCLILGNGASVALQGKDSPLTYNSLYEEAEKRGFISQEGLGVFKYFNTSEFEWVMRAVSDANAINQSIGVIEEKTSDIYDLIKDALINCVNEVHPSPDKIRGHFAAMAEFMKKFPTVFSLNYDLSVYWAIMKANHDVRGSLFKDCFNGAGEFTSDYEWLRGAAKGLASSTLVFYPHGSLALVTDIFGGESKVSAPLHHTLLDGIADRWRAGRESPLFVSEGHSAKKLRAIRGSSYLNQVYTELSSAKDSAIIYGWACGDQDSHILEALGQAGVSRFGISVYTKGRDPDHFCYEVQRAIRNIRGLENAQVEFFDSEESGVWIAN